ncbi:MAG TPA: hypothetical protein V6D14_25360 [Coleofasciculaceae cyanobacterium]|jgi:hypothetical protein
MSQHRPVPRLDLAPNLRRPLSLWNPLDYLRLLYWVFFFPQALRQYLYVYYRGLIPNENPSRKNLWGLLPNPKLRQLVFQGIILAIITPLIQGVILNRIGLLLDYKSILGNYILIALFSIIIVFAFIVYKTESKNNTENIFQLSIGLGIGLDVTLNLVVSTFSAPSKEVFANFASIAFLSLLGGFWIGVASVLVLGVLTDVSVFFLFIMGIFVLILATFMGLMMPVQKIPTDLGITTTILVFLVSVTASIIGTCLAFIRLDNWFFSLFFFAKRN